MEEENIELYRQQIAYFRKYPDVLVDFFCQISGEECHFNLYNYQRIMMRVMARYRQTFITASRGVSKSFTNILAKICQCILYPNSKIAIASGEKGQSSKILQACVSDILSMIPAIKQEIYKIQKNKDEYLITFKNGSYLMNVISGPATRGLRFCSLVLEEVVLIDDKIIKEVLEPTLDVMRRLSDGSFDPEETATMQKISITTAGSKMHPSYSDALKTYALMVASENEGFYMGFSYRVPVVSGLHALSYYQRTMLSQKGDMEGFYREYMSIWGNVNEASFFSVDAFAKHRSLTDPELKRADNLKRGSNYVICLDVSAGLGGDNSVYTVWKYEGARGIISTKSLVYMETSHKDDFEEQTIRLKQLYFAFEPIGIVFDATGIGASIAEGMSKAQMDQYQNYLPPFQILNFEDGKPDERYKKYQTSDMVKGICYAAKANLNFNSEMYSNYAVQLQSGKLRFLQDERVAGNYIRSSHAKRFLEMTAEQKTDYLLPFVNTTILQTELGNLIKEKEGATVVLKRQFSGVKKDRVSSSGYGLYWIKKYVDDINMQTVAQGRAKGYGTAATKSTSTERKRWVKR